jgi:hypothetical protein
MSLSNPLTPTNNVGEIKLMDFRDYKFRCHYLGDLIGSYLSEEAKPALTDKQNETYLKLKSKDKLTDLQTTTLADFEAKIEAKNNPILEITQGSKSVLHKIWNFETLQIKEVLKSKAVRRGKNQEDESIDLVNQVFKTNLVKNTERFENDYFTGEPDLITQKSVIDIKTCESWETFWSKTSEKAHTDYFYQVWAYMLLTGKNQGFVAYTLPSYDQEFISYAQSSTIDLEEAEQTFFNLNFDRIPKNKRIKIFKLESRKIDTVKVYKYLDKCREYLDNLTTQFQNFQPLA